jgi:GNAT superfamily N-acetyltransferase
LTRQIQSVKVRAAGKNDAEAVARLAGELGYPSTVAQIRERLDLIDGDPQHATFVAVAGGGAVVGWIQLSRMCSLVTDPRAEITGLIVDSMHRGDGVGRLLVDRGEAWAREQRLAAMGVRSNVVREGAHRFYVRLGYAITKSQNVFRNDL